MKNYIDKINILGPINDNSLPSLDHDITLVPQDDGNVSIVYEEKNMTFGEASSETHKKLEEAKKY